MRGFAAHERSARRASSLLAPADLLDADRLFQGEHEPGADRLHDRGRPALLADLGIGVVGLRRRADEQDRPAARHRRHRGSQQPPLGDEHAGRPGAAGELVGREEHRVLVREAPVAGGRATAFISIGRYGPAAA